MRHWEAIVMLNEVKHLTVNHGDSMEMFRYAQHDIAPTAFSRFSPRGKKIAHTKAKETLARKLVALEAAHVRVTLEPPDQVALGHVDLPDIAE